MSSVENLCGLIDALSETTDGGRLIRTGIDAQAISAGVDEVYEAYDCFHRCRIAAKSQPLAELPPGIQLMGSDSPDGPFEPIPASARTISVATIGKKAVEPAVAAILHRITEALAFLPDRWNAMQSRRPGDDHRRFHAGDVIPRAALAGLVQAEKLLRLDRENGGEDPTDGPDQVVKLIKAFPPSGTAESAIEGRVRDWLGKQKSGRSKDVSVLRVAAPLLLSAMDRPGTAAPIPDHFSAVEKMTRALNRDIPESRGWFVPKCTSLEKSVTYIRGRKHVGGTGKCGR